MKPVSTSTTTRTLGAPENYVAEYHDGVPCESLPITDHDGNMYSYWSLSWGERLAVLFGRKIRLIVPGAVHPVVMLDTQT